MSETKTLLDEFAMAALPQLIGGGRDGEEDARDAYGLAAAMLAERAKRMPQFDLKPPTVTLEPWNKPDCHITHLLGYPIDSWTKLQSECKARFNVSDPSEAADRLTALCRMKVQLGVPSPDFTVSASQISLELPTGERVHPKADVRFKDGTNVDEIVFDAFEAHDPLVRELCEQIEQYKGGEEINGLANPALHRCEECGPMARALRAIYDRWKAGGGDCDQIELAPLKPTGQVAVKITQPDRIRELAIEAVEPRLKDDLFSVRWNALCAEVRRVLAGKPSEAEPPSIEALTIEALRSTADKAIARVTAAESRVAELKAKLSARDEMEEAEHWHVEADLAYVRTDLESSRSMGQDMTKSDVSRAYWLARARVLELREKQKEVQP